MHGLNFSTIEKFNHSRLFGYLSGTFQLPKCTIKSPPPPHSQSHPSPSDLSPAVCDSRAPEHPAPLPCLSAPACRSRPLPSSPALPEPRNPAIRPEPPHPLTAIPCRAHAAPSNLSCPSSTFVSAPHFSGLPSSIS